MKLVRFPQGDSVILVDPEKVAYIKRSVKPYRDDFPPPAVDICFCRGDEWLEFTGKDAERVWDYFAKEFNVG